MASDRARAGLAASLVSGLVSGLVVLLGVGCAAAPRRFALAPPLWEDDDRAPVATRPSKYVSGLVADGADQMFLRKLSDLAASHDPGEALNVNALDEVPNSAWFTNRIGRFPMTPEAVARGACTDRLDATQGPWVVVAAKPNGANPGFFIKAPNGKRYLLKADGVLQPERNTAADVIGSKLFYAAGYHVPCYQVAYFDPKILTIAPDATAEDALGRDRPITQADVDAVLGQCARRKDGLFRAGMSEFVAGKPLGPFRYEGTRGDDPNDVIDHRDRRELRGAKILAAWLGHFDSREQNSLDVWVEDQGRSYVRHYYIDFGSSFGSRWPIDAMSRRFGFSYYFDTLDVLGDLLSLGIVDRPWEHVKINPGSEIFGYFEDERFDPTTWKGGYPNPAFERATRRDQLWMARIIAHFDEAHLRAAIAEAELSDPRAEAWLLQAMRGRQRRIFEDAFLQDDPLDHWQLVRRTPGEARQSLCFENWATKLGLVPPETVTYKWRFHGGDDLAELLGWLQFTPDLEHPERACVLLPIGHRRPSERTAPSAPDDDPSRYGVLKVYVHARPGFAPTSVVYLHLYDLGPERGFRLVGLERPPRIDLPPAF